MIVTKNFFKTIPIEQREHVTKKISRFDSELLKYENYTQLPKGFWVRRIQGTDIYKFRTSKGDRVLYCYKNDEGRRDIVYIAFKKHDDQITDAKNINKLVPLEIDSFDIDRSSYVEEKIDEELYDFYKDYINNNQYVDLAKLQEDVLEDEYLHMLLDENDEQYLNYLSDEQYQCLSIMDKPLLISGSAGSGKSMVALRKMLLNTEAEIKSVYITYSPYLKYKLHEDYNKHNLNKSFVDFYHINELFKSIINRNDINVTTAADFIAWLEDNKEHFSDLLKHMCSEEIWIEINGYIKGYGNSSWNRNSNVLSEEEYLNCESSNLDVKLKKKIYQLSKMYNNWLAQNDFMDENDLAFAVLDYIKKNNVDRYQYMIIDEIQDMTELQFMAAKELIVNMNNLMAIGDENQVTRLNYFNFSRIKSYMYNECDEVENFNFVKNYRNTDAIHNVAEKIIELKNEKCKSSSGSRVEIAERNGEKPVIIQTHENMNQLFELTADNKDIVIIVNDEAKRNLLKDKGYNVDRVFTIDEIKGLDYESVICINVLYGNYEVMEKHNFENKNDMLLKQKYNEVYVAFTRARNNLCIIEEKECTSSDNIKNLCTPKNTIDYKLLKIHTKSEKSEWLKEAMKLEKSERYVHALAAYKKAEDSEGIKRCEEKIAVKERKIVNITDAAAVRIQTDNNPLNFAMIQKALAKICKVFKLELDSYAELIVNNKSGECKMEEFHGESDDIIKELSNLCISLLENDDVKKNKITIHISFKRNNKYISLKDLYSKDYDTLILDCYNKNKIVINPAKTRSELQEVFQKLSSELNKQRLYSDSNEDNGEDELTAVRKEISKLYQEADALNRRGNFNEALKKYTSILEMKSEEYIDLMFLGNIDELYSRMCGCYSNMGDYANAIVYGEKAVAKNPKNNYDAYNNLATSYLNDGEYERAIELYERAKKVNSSYSAAYTGIKQAKRFIEENKIFGGGKRKTITGKKLDKISLDISNAIEARNINKAEALLNDTMKTYHFSDPQQSGIYAMYAMCNSAKMDYEKALEMLDKSIELNPNNNAAHAYRRYIKQKM